MVEAKKRRSEWGTWVAVICFGVPVLYVMCIGPLSLLESEDMIPEPIYSILVVVYTPLRRVAEVYPGVDEWLTWYAALWSSD